MATPPPNPPSDPKALEGRRVHFRIEDASVPEASEILARMHGRDLLHGRVTDLTTSGPDSEAFAVVEVDELHQPVVVAIHCLNPPPATCPPH